MSLFPKKNIQIANDEDPEEDDEEAVALLFSKPARGAPGGTTGKGIFYGSTAGRMSTTAILIQERGIVVGKPVMLTKAVKHQVAEIVYALFAYEHHHSHAHPRTNPVLPPEPRFARHRNFYIFELNQFRHWWKTSRLLVRVSAGIVYAQDPVNWVSMASWDTAMRKQCKAAATQSKRIGQGGPVKPFLDEVQPFTRIIRIVLAIARAWEARVDNRLYEVGLAEALYV